MFSPDTAAVPVAPVAPVAGRRGAVALVLPRPLAGGRGVALLATVALALVLLVAPTFGTRADAATRPAVASPVTRGDARFVPLVITTRVTTWYAERMLARVNGERSMLGRAALHMNAKLIRSAHAHNLAMARADVLSHQLPGEAVFTDRISRAGYRWLSAGENIGWTTDLSLQGIYGLEDAMFHEKAPDNGHRLNIINTHYRDVGIDVYYDRTHHAVWFTQDFGQPA